MDEPKAMRTRLRSLVIFRNLLRDPVVTRLDALLGAPLSDGPAVAEALGAFASALFETDMDWSACLLRAVLRSDDICVRYVAAGQELPPELHACLSRELNFLQALSRFDGAAQRSAVPFPEEAPRWRISELDFAARYEEMLGALSTRGWGIFALSHVFTIHSGALRPVPHPDPQRLSELSGYERERAAVVDNTRALLSGKPAANVLLYGDAGTGKSSTVKAIANEFAPEGLRLVEVKKNQLYEIPALLGALCGNPLKFILFIDDLSFAENDDDFAALKGILEGGVSARGDNIAIYATSNRRHLVKERMADREGDDLRAADTMQEIASLSARFGLTVTFLRPDRDAYFRIVHTLAAARGLLVSEQELLSGAETFAIRSGGRTPRAAKQYIERLSAER